MFDDQTTSAPTPPSNLPVEPDDIFKELEQTPEAPTKPNALNSGMLKPKAPAEPAAPTTAPAPSEPSRSRPAEGSVVIPPSIELMGRQGETIAPVSNPILGKVLLTVLIFIIVGGGAFGGWWVYTNIIQNKAVKSTVETTPDTSVTPTPTPTPTPTTEVLPTAPTTETNNTSNENTAVMDTDSDGLPDTQEKALGTDASKADTDGDGLTDGDEVLKYRSNPLKADTDGDGYSDGTEVSNGYNPNGPGKLTTTPSGSPATSSPTNSDLPPTERMNQNASSTSLPPAVAL